MTLLPIICCNHSPDLVGPPTSHLSCSLIPHQAPPLMHSHLMKMTCMAQTLMSKPSASGPCYNTLSQNPQQQRWTIPWYLLFCLLQQVSLLTCDYFIQDAEIIAQFNTLNMSLNQSYAMLSALYVTAELCTLSTSSEEDDDASVMSSQQDDLGGLEAQDMIDDDGVIFDT